VTTSGTVSYDLVTSEIIDKAFRILGKSSEGEALSARMYEDGRTSLNLLLKTWGTMEHLWTKTERSLTLVANTAAYVLTPKPGRVLSVRRRYTYGTSVTDIPLNEMSRQEYMEMPVKTSSPSTPNSWYYDPQATTGTLYVWPAPSTAVVTENTLQITYLRRIEDMNATGDSLDMPQEWLQAVIWNLADELETEYPVNDPRLAAKIAGKAVQLKAMLKSWDTEPASLYMQPEYQPWSN
jgi:hypothetical protein